MRKIIGRVLDRLCDDAEWLVPVVGCCWLAGVLIMFLVVR